MLNSRPSNPRAVHFLLEGVAVLILTILTVVVVILFITRPSIRYDQQQIPMEQTVQARIVKILSENTQTTEEGMTQLFQTMEIEILSAGEYQGQTLEINYNAYAATQRDVRYKAGELAMVMISTRPDGKVIFSLADHVRQWPLLALTILLILVTVIVGRGQGLRALIGLLLSGLLIGAFIIPQILAHRDPVLISLTGTALLISVTLYLIQGWNSTAHAAMFSMVASLALTGLLALVWVQFTYLSGFGSEETLYLQAMGVGLEMRGLLLAGIVIGVAGVLDDVVLAQAVTTFTLAETDPTLTIRQLYQQAMKIGRAHLASMINTLILAYASSALPLMLLFYLFPEPWYLTINRELIAEEIVRAIVGSLGLLGAVPLTSLISAWAAAATRPQ